MIDQLGEDMFRTVVSYVAFEEYVSLRLSSKSLQKISESYFPKWLHDIKKQEERISAIETTDKNLEEFQKMLRWRFPRRTHFDACEMFNVGIKSISQHYATYKSFGTHSKVVSTTIICLGHNNEAWFAFLRSLPSLKTLQIMWHLPDQLLSTVPQIESLCLFSIDNFEANNVFEQISSLKSLKRLSISNFVVSLHNCPLIAKSLSGIHINYLEFACHIDSFLVKAIFEIINACPSLLFLELISEDEMSLDNIHHVVYIQNYFEIQPVFVQVRIRIDKHIFRRRNGRIEFSRYDIEYWRQLTFEMCDK